GRLCCRLGRRAALRRRKGRRRTGPASAIPASRSGTKPSASPKSERSRRSRSNRATASAPVVFASSLIATSRPSGPRARMTTPMPPRPTSPITSYGPMFIEELKGDALAEVLREALLHHLIERLPRRPEDEAALAVLVELEAVADGGDPDLPRAGVRGDHPLGLRLPDLDRHLRV